MMNPVFLLLMLLAIGCSTESFDDYSYVQSEKDKKTPWTDVGKSVKGFVELDIRELEVLDDKVKDANGNEYQSIIDLNEIVKQTKKTKVVVQVIETFPSGGLCRGCINKGNLISREILKDKVLAKDTAYIMVISGKYTPSDNALAFARRYADKGTKIIRDIDGELQETFKTGDFPVTLVIESQYRGNILNMHRTQPSAVVRALKNLPK